MKTIAEIKENLFNKEMLELLVTDYQTGKAYSEMESIDQDNNWFTKPVHEKARDIAEHIQRTIGIALENNIKEILENDAE